MSKKSRARRRNVFGAQARRQHVGEMKMCFGPDGTTFLKRFAVGRFFQRFAVGPSKTFCRRSFFSWKSKRVAVGQRRNVLISTKKTPDGTTFWRARRQNVGTSGRRQNVSETLCRRGQNTFWFSQRVAVGLVPKNVSPSVVRENVLPSGRKRENARRQKVLVKTPDGETFCFPQNVSPSTDGETFWGKSGKTTDGKTFC